MSIWGDPHYSDDSHPSEIKVVVQSWAEHRREELAHLDHLRAAGARMAANRAELRAAIDARFPLWHWEDEQPFLRRCLLAILPRHREEIPVSYRQFPETIRVKSLRGRYYITVLPWWTSYSSKQKATEPT